MSNIPEVKPGILAVIKVCSLYDLQLSYTTALISFLQNPVVPVGSSDVVVLIKPVGVLLVDVIEVCVGREQVCINGSMGTITLSEKTDEEGTTGVDVVQAQGDNIPRLRLLFVDPPAEVNRTEVSTTLMAETVELRKDPFDKVVSLLKEINKC